MAEKKSKKPRTATAKTAPEEKAAPLPEETSTMGVAPAGEPAAAEKSAKQDPPAKNKTPVGGLKVARTLQITKPLMKGDDVVQLQKALIARNYACGAAGAGGIYDRFTAQAVRHFQAANGLIVDGRAGEKTITALGGEWMGK